MNDYLRRIYNIFGCNNELLEFIAKLSTEIEKCNEHFF
jgi:hypothetical protein